MKFLGATAVLGAIALVLALAAARAASRAKALHGWVIGLLVLGAASFVFRGGFHSEPWALLPMAAAALVLDFAFPVFFASIAAILAICCANLVIAGPRFAPLSFVLVAGVACIAGTLLERAGKSAARIGAAGAMWGGVALWAAAAFLVAQVSPFPLPWPPVAMTAPALGIVAIVLAALAPRATNLTLLAVATLALAPRLPAAPILGILGTALSWRAVDHFARRLRRLGASTPNLAPSTAIVSIVALGLAICWGGTIPVATMPVPMLLAAALVLTFVMDSSSRAPAVVAALLVAFGIFIGRGDGPFAIVLPSIAASILGVLLRLRSVRAALLVRGVATGFQRSLAGVAALLLAAAIAFTFERTGAVPPWPIAAAALAILLVARFPIAILLSGAAFAFERNPVRLGGAALLFFVIASLLEMRAIRRALARAGLALGIDRAELPRAGWLTGVALGALAMGRAAGAWVPIVALALAAVRLTSRRAGA